MFISKPPIVVFILSLFAFALTTLILGFIVRQREEIQNPDILNWNLFFSKLSQLDFCVSDHNIKDTKINLNHNETVTTSVLVPMSHIFISNFKETFSKLDTFNLQGNVLVNHMDRGLLEKYRNSLVTLTFHLNDVQNSDNQDQDDICVTIDAPNVMINDLNQGRSPVKCNKSIDEAPSLYFESTPQEHHPKGWCKNGTDMRLTYEDQDNLVVYISAMDKNLIYLHLMCTSVFLFVLATLVIVLTMFRNRKNPRKKIDERGDMQLLSQEEYNN